VTATIFYQILFMLFPIGVAFGAASDIVTMTIPNRLVIALAAAFVVMAPLTGMAWTTFAFHWLVAFVVLALAFGCFAAGWIGGGDAKFAAAIVLWLGPVHALEFVVVSAIFGGVLTVAVVAFRQKLLPAFALRQTWLFRLHDPNAGVPYGVALAAAALLLYPQTIWISLVLA
jgi:prepilin peptidase CpaA